MLQTLQARSIFEYQFYNAQRLPAVEPRHATTIIIIVIEMARVNFTN